ncbi:hypothetical protein CVS40_6791 [Lucilia cuprina]|nr:hypothetical protein CVS40_6791 [Lucilia cuprina]
MYCISLCLIVFLFFLFLSKIFLFDLDVEITNFIYNLYSLTKRFCQPKYIQMRTVITEFVNDRYHNSFNIMNSFREQLNLNTNVNRVEPMPESFEENCREIRILLTFLLKIHIIVQCLKDHFLGSLLRTFSIENSYNKPSITLGYISLFYRYYNGICSSEIRELVPDTHLYLILKKTQQFYIKTQPYLDNLVFLKNSLYFGISLLVLFVLSTFYSYYFYLTNSLTQF